MRFEALLDRHERGELSQVEAAELLGVGERTFRRWRDRFVEEGLDGLIDRRIGRPSAKRAPEAELVRMLGLYRAHYEGFTVKHFHEQLQKRHGYKLGYTVTKLRLHTAGYVKPAVKRSAHRKKRPRRPMVGMMLHQDASRHVWLEALGRPLDLVVTLDDATSAIYSAFLVEEEGTASSFRGLREVVGDAWSVLLALHGSRQPLFPHSESGRAGVEDGTDAGRAGAGATGRGTHRGLFAAGPGPVGAGLPHLAGSLAEGAATGRDRDGRSSARSLRSPGAA